MRGHVISYIEMCQREGTSLQRGMNFHLRPSHSVILMSVRPNSPYRDEVSEDGNTLIYEGHDWPKSQGGPDPKTVDQPAFSRNGKATQNGKFLQAARAYQEEPQSAEVVQVYEKIKDGIWTDNGRFLLVDAWQTSDGLRQVFRFKLQVISDELTDSAKEEQALRALAQRSRIIPTEVKQKVWARDGGKCVQCGAANELHFDHILPYSKGGTSLKVDNVQLLCARHNLSKSAKIM